MFKSEYYFSNDWYLRSFMDEEGFVSAEEIAKFHKIANMNVPPDLVGLIFFD